MSFFGPLILRLLAGFLLAWILGNYFGADGSPSGYLGAVVVFGGLTAVLLDRYDRHVFEGVGSLGEQPEPPPSPERS